MFLKIVKQTEDRGRAKTDTSLHPEVNLVHNNALNADGAYILT